MTQERVFFGPEIDVILFLVDEHYEARHPEVLERVCWKNFNWRNTLKIASKNRVIYHFANSVLERDPVLREIGDTRVVETLKEIVTEGDKQREKLRATLSFIKEALDGKVSYMLLKTEQHIPYVTNDVDILILDRKEYAVAVRIMADRGAVYRPDETYKGASLKEGLLIIEPHNAVTWYGMRFFDDTFISNNPRRVTLMDLAFDAPSNEAALAVHLAHAVFDCQYVILRDLTAVFGLLDENIDWGIIEAQAGKYGWTSALTYSTSFAAKVFSEMYGYGVNVGPAASRFRDIKRFPYWCSLLNLVPAFAEKIQTDAKEGINISFKTLSEIVIYYIYKRLRSRLPGRLYFVHSWLY